MISKDLIKRFSIIFLPLAVLIAVVEVAIYYTDVRTEESIIKASQINNMDFQMELVASNFKSIVMDLVVIAEQHQTKMIFESAEGSESRKNALNRVNRHLLKLLDSTGIYDNILLLDKTGTEIVRVNYNNGNPAIATKDKLQFKGNRYYFNDTFELGEREIFVSPFDLNVEEGKIEQPVKPIIRFGAPVFDHHGQKVGILIISYLGIKLINNIEKTTAKLQGNVMLLNSDGYWLHGRHPENNFGFMYEDKKNMTFENDFRDAWQQISNTESGQLINKDGMFTFTTIYPLMETWKSSTGGPGDSKIGAKSYHWKLVSHIPPDILYEKSQKLLGRLLLIFSVLFIFLLITSWSMAHLSGEKIVLKKRTLSPFNALVTIAVLVFLSELLVMIVLRYMDPASLLVEALIDSSMLLILITPSLYFFLFRPLIQYINDRKIAEENLIISEQKINAIIQTVGEGIIVIGPDSMIRFVNPELCDIFGYSEEDLVGRNILELMPGKYREPHTAGMNKYLEGGKAKILGYRLELEGLRKGGEVFPLDLKICEIRVEKDNDRFFTASIRDITKRKQDEQLREELISDLNNINAELKDFAFVVSHDLKAPLRAITSLATWIKKDYANVLDEEGCENLDLLVARTKRMSNLIGGILHYSRLGQKKPEPEWLDSKEIAHYVTDAIVPPGNISVRIEGTFPRIQYDLTHLEQLFQNLIYNAIIHLGKPEGEVVVSCRDSNDFFEFCVRDNGVGIEERHFERIFKMCQSLKPRDEVETSGIGLFLVKKIVETYNGRVWVESVVGEGSAFYFTIPKPAEPEPNRELKTENVETV